jgi:glycosyltransferase involved in cell wall biosynthesis
MTPGISLVVPVYNRAEEVRELLDSLLACGELPDEIIIIEDGSAYPCDQVVEAFSSRLPIQYMQKANSGPGLSRNVGAGLARCDYILFVDSDCLLPPGYFTAIRQFLRINPVDFFGGPDAAHADFSPVQKAISQAMTGILTTGGIRGASEKMDRFFPRSFNMGISKKAFDAVGGFHSMRFGEDIDLSIRLFKAGYRSALIREAWLYHKRRTHFRQFFKQVYNSGMARVLLHRLHPGTLKLVHLLPAAFTLGSAALLVLALSLTWLAGLPILLVALAFFAESLIKGLGLPVSILSVPAAFLQLWGYGLGFLHAWVSTYFLGKGRFQAFDRSFYR